MKTTIGIATVATLALLSTGCVRFSTVQKDVRYDEESGKPATAITTKASAYSLFQGRQALASWKAQQSEGEQGAEVGGVDQETDAAKDMAAIISALSDLAKAIK
jgi:hypothetical protein